MTGFTGATVSIRNGPRWPGPLQLPALSRVRRWNHQSPSARTGLVVDPAPVAASFVSSGAEVASWVQPYETPSTPLCTSLPLLQEMSTVGSFDHAPGMWLGLASDGFTGAARSTRNGPSCAAALQLPALSRLRRWNHHSPSASGGPVEPETVSSASFDVSGAVASILNGPRWTAALQFPATSTARRWNHHEPSATAPLVADEAPGSFVASGTVAAVCDHS